MGARTASGLARDVSRVMQDVLIHQRPRWGLLLGHQRQYEGWWKAELATALESWCWTSATFESPLAVLPEAKPRDFGLSELACGQADILVAPWSEQEKRVSRTERPRVWVEIKTRATWWGDSVGGAAKAFGDANAGLASDLQKWRSVDSAGDAVVACHITAHDGPWEEQLPKPWLDELERVTKPLVAAAPALTVGFEIPGRDNEPRYRWARMDCLLLHGG